MLWLVKKPFILIADLFSSLLQWIFYPSKQQAVELTTPPPKLKFTETIKKLNKKRVPNHFCLHQPMYNALILDPIGMDET